MEPRRGSRLRSNPLSAPASCDAHLSKLFSTACRLAPIYDAVVGASQK